MTKTKLRWGFAALAAYIGTIILANYFIGHVGIKPPVPAAPHTFYVGFGQYAPSGVYFVALALVLRNVVQRVLGREIAVTAILIGAAVSYFVAAPAVAVASGVAFLCSEALDMAIYTPLRRYGQFRAVLPASLAGGLLDSYIFLTIAFGSLTFWPGQALGKTWGVLAAAVILFLSEQTVNKLRGAHGWRGWREHVEFA